MPSFKGSDGKDRFHPNPQVARSMGSPPAAAMGEDPNADQAGGMDDMGGDDGDFVEIHKGEHPEGQPPPDGTMTHHTVIHKKAMMGDQSLGMGPTDSAEIHNHHSYDEAEADARANMDAGDMDDASDDGGGDELPGDGSDEG